MVYASVTDYILSPTNEGGTAVISIIKFWKSTTPIKLVVNSLTSCGFNFEVGKDYLLFLHQDSTGLFYTDSCSGNKILNSKNEFDNTLNALIIKK